MKKTIACQIPTHALTKKLFFTTLFAYLLSAASLSQAALIDFTWTSTDMSSVSVMLGPEATFKWKNADGSEVNLTGGTLGASFSMTDSKTKGGSVNVDPLSIKELINPNHGKNGEPPVKMTGQITEGTGAFQLSLKGFKEIADIDATFFATLVSNGTDNPINLSVFGQGDQLTFTPPGSVDYVSKWTSSDVINLSNGQQLQIGNFFLMGGSEFLSDSSAASFEYSLQGDSPANLVFASSFTSGEKYIFTDNTFNAELFEIAGKVSKTIRSVPEPTTSLLLLTGIISLVYARKKHLR